MTSGVSFDVVIPTVGRASLGDLLQTLLSAGEPAPGRIVVVDDRSTNRRHRDLADLIGATGSSNPPPITFAVSGGRGPAAARNVGWRRCAARWVCFLDDDVVPRPGWNAALASDLVAAGPEVAAVQGRLHVPLPVDRRPSDWERNVAGLETAWWITADLAVRREALVSVGGFDERFPRAYREDSDLALRLLDAGWALRKGQRASDHPVRRAGWWSGVTAQRGNADDALMARLHGRDWRQRATAPPGALGWHCVTSAALCSALLATGTRLHRRTLVAAGAWLASTAAFWWRRAAPGPRNLGELARLAVSSTAIPPAASWWAVAGRARARRLAPRGRADRWGPAAPQLVLFDRDGTLVEDVPYNGEPAAVRPVDGARAALDRLRRAGVAVGLITNQSGVARGLLGVDDVADVNRRVVELLGPFDTVQVCHHGPGDGCVCRKPAPGMVVAAADAVGVAPHRCAVIGDIGSDVAAGLTVGARAILVPGAATRRTEVVTAPEVAADLNSAVAMLLDGHRRQEVRR